MTIRVLGLPLNQLVVDLVKDNIAHCFQLTCVKGMRYKLAPRLIRWVIWLSKTKSIPNKIWKEPLGMFLLREDTIEGDEEFLIVVWIVHEKLKPVRPVHTNTWWYPFFVGVLFLHESGHLSLVWFRHNTRYKSSNIANERYRNCGHKCYTLFSVVPPQITHLKEPLIT